MVIFGFDECPSCQALGQLLFGHKDTITKEIFFPFVSDTEIISNEIPALSVVRVRIRNENAESIVESLDLVVYSESKKCNKRCHKSAISTSPSKI